MKATNYLRIFNDLEDFIFIFCMILENDVTFLGFELFTSIKLQPWKFKERENVLL